MIRTLSLLLALVFASVTGAAKEAFISSEIVFDDACGENERECAFWSCYETGKCDEEDLANFQEQQNREVAVKRDESPRKEMGEMRRVVDECLMYISPKPAAEAVGSPLQIGRRVWTVPSIVGWTKVFRSSGPAYVRSSCFK